MNIIFVHCPKTAGCSVSRAIGGCHSDNKNSCVLDGHRSITYYENTSDYFVFTVTRNPWDRVVSCFNYANKRIKNDGSYWLMKFQSFKDFVYHLKDVNDEFGLGGEKAFKDEPKKLKLSLGRCYLRNILDCVSIDGVVRANYICNMHTLDEDWKNLSKLINANSNLEKINVGKHTDYRHYYDVELRQIIGSIYKKDIDYFGYSFEDKNISSFKRLLDR